MRAAVVTTVVFVVFAWAAVAQASVLPPHVSAGSGTDTCAMCHRGHSSASGVEASTSTTENPVNALTVGGFATDDGDVLLCYSCHSMEGLGSSIDVEFEFDKLSYHRLTPEPSPYGPARKQCSSCHDSHGSAKVATDTPYPALLRVLESSSSAVYTGNKYCTTCHDLNTSDLWDGMAIWRQTAHADITPTVSGTGIVCSACHAPHGSDNTALIVETLNPPSAPETVTVPANDRWLCYGCHAVALATYKGGYTYERSSHGSSDATIPVTAEWASRLPAESAETSRAAGECQSCHVAMGADDGSGNPIAKLATAEGSMLCFDCHGLGSKIATDVASVYETAGAPVLEVVAAYAAANTSRQFGVAQIYTRDATSSATLSSPRQALETSVGPTATGDIDADGESEVLVSRSGSPRLSILQQTTLSGLEAEETTLLAEPVFLAVGDVLPDTAGLKEIVAADDSAIRVYRWSVSGLTPVAAIPTLETVTGIATGDVTGTTNDDIVATVATGAGQGRLLVLDGGSGSLEVFGDYSLGARLPQGPDVGELSGEGKREIALVFGQENSNVLGVYDAAGTLLAQGGSTSGNQAAQRAHIGDVLWGVAADGRSPAEISVTFAQANAGARVDVFPQTTTGSLDTTITYTLPEHSNPANMDSGDVDGDGKKELVVSLAGSFGDRVPAGIRVLQTNADGTAIASSDSYVPGGMEIADSAPGQAWVAVVDLGELGSSRHVVDAAFDSHVSTETLTFTRHVECVDCHNVHEATSTAGVAPQAYGVIQGTTGVEIDNAPAGSITYTVKRGIDYEYELCLKCHNGVNMGARRDIASEVDTRNPSFHAIEGRATNSQVVAGTFRVGSTWNNDSILYCVDCHGNSRGAEAQGPHASAEAPILKSPYFGIPASSQDRVCFSCHRYDVFYNGDVDLVASTGSRFWNPNQPRRLHRLHGFTNSIGCSACHTSHGSAEEHLLRSDVGWEHDDAKTPGDGLGGSCTNNCHPKMEYEGR